jgi:ATP-dependent helicase Lhr and Lhr-like helicase
MIPPHPLIHRLFAARGWQPSDFQHETWQAYAEGKSGLLHAPTGTGKTLAVWLGPVAEALETPTAPEGCRVLWLTPLRALAQDTARSLAEPLKELGDVLEVAVRTGDTSSYRKAKLRERLPFALVTTPESLSLMFTYEDSRKKLEGLTCVVIDEWHELIGTKRGVQTELCLARLRHWAPKLRIWGISATLGNMQQAADVLAGNSVQRMTLINSAIRRPIEIRTMIPKSIEAFPWGGHSGLALAGRVAKSLHRATASLVFTNTRSQSEIWLQALLEKDVSLQGRISIHHGSLSHDERRETERRLMQGDLLAVVCTSSLDLGLDFSCIEQVIQIGSPKGVARLLQRAGRSGHQPGKKPRLICVPTNALELLEFAAAQDAMDAGEIESKRPLMQPLDVLIQHVTSCAIGERIAEARFLEEVRSTYAYSALSAENWEWMLGFISNGGVALSAYPQYRKVTREQGFLHFTDKRMIQLHRMNIGTIASDTAISLRFANGRRIGSVEEGFIRRLKPGSAFIFSGRLLTLVRVHQLIATVKPCLRSKARGEIPIWHGGKMPLSTELSHAVARRLDADATLPTRPETEAIEHLLRIQRQWSQVPNDHVLQIEHARSRQGEHLFFYTFAGRLANEGLGALFAHRLSEGSPQSIQVSQNDYGFCLTSSRTLPLDEGRLRMVASTDDLLETLLSCLNTHELSRTRFREVARVAGLIQQMQPGERKGMRQIQTSAGLLFEVFARYDPENLLLTQSRREVLESTLELERLRTALDDIAKKPLRLIELERLTPMAFPLWAERLNFVISTQDAASVLEEMLATLNSEANAILQQA